MGPLNRPLGSSPSRCNRGPPLIEAGAIYRGEEGSLRPQMELLKNEMKIRRGRGRGTRTEIQIKIKKTASKNEAVYLSSVED